MITGRNIPVIALVLCCCTASAQLRHFYYSTDSLQCYYTIKDGKFTGLYKSYYKNGVLRSEGNLLNGYRTGKWTVFDSSGKKRMERVYTSPFDYKRVIPSPPDDPAAALLFPNTYKLQYDTNGVIEYAKVEAGNTIWRNKYWRLAESAQNEILFKNDLLITVIINQIRYEGLKVYDTTDDRFTMIDTTAASRFSTGIKMSGLLIKEESFFDRERMCYECRILGICPLVKTGNKTRKLGWLYYPDARRRFAKVQLNNRTLPRSIHTLDDWFVFRYYSGVILKTTVDNPYNTPLNEYPGMTASLLKEEQLKQEINIIEQEHNIWLEFSR